MPKHGKKCRSRNIQSNKSLRFKEKIRRKSSVRTKFSKNYSNDDTVLIEKNTTVPDNRHWTNEMEAISHRTMCQANGYVWIYDNMVSSAKQWDNNLNIASGMLGSIIGTAGIISVETDTGTPLWARILQIIVGFLITLVSVLTATWRLGETQSNGILTQASYATLAKDIMWQLALPQYDRQDARKYVKIKLGEIEQLKVSAPIISIASRNAYNNKFKNNPIYDDSFDQFTTHHDVQFTTPRNVQFTTPRDVQVAVNETSI